MRATGDIMKLLCFSDFNAALHLGNQFSQTIQQEDPDIIFYCGGTMRGIKRIAEFESAMRFQSKPSSDSLEIQEEIKKDLEFLKSFIQILVDTQKPVYLVPGRTDAPEAEYFKIIYQYHRIYPNLKSIHGEIAEDDLFILSGFGGDLGQSFDDRNFLLQYTRSWVEFTLRTLEFINRDKILIFYSPPVCRLDLKENGEHCGVIVVNELIERFSPKILICGQATNHGVVRLGETVVVNPGLFFMNGKYAVIDFPSLDVQFKSMVN